MSEPTPPPANQGPAFGDGPMPTPPPREHAWRPPVPPQAQPPAPKKRSAGPWVLACVGAFIVGILIGIALTVGNTSTPAPRVTTVAAAPGPDATREAELDERERAVMTRESQAQVREAELKTREDALVVQEQARDANRMPGDGVYAVGPDVQPGTYVTAGPSGRNPVGCYYAFKSSTEADADILSNNIVNGQARVTLKEGQVFESQSCQEWVRQ